MNFAYHLDLELRRYFAHLGPEATKMRNAILAAHEQVKKEALKAELEALVGSEGTVLSPISGDWYRETIKMRLAELEQERQGGGVND